MKLTFANEPTCAGADRAWTAGQPDWFNQADAQMGALLSTLMEINDPTALEAWDALEAALIRAAGLKFGAA